MKIALRIATTAAIGISSACSSSTNGPGDAPPTASLEIVAASGGPLETVAGDAMRLKVVELQPDGSTVDLPAGSNVEWRSPSAPVSALPPDSEDPSPLPAAGGDPSVTWLSNPSRPDLGEDLANVLFVLDPGSVQNAAVQVSATVSGATVSGDVSATIRVDPTPAGDWTRGAALYGPTGANCAECHGPTGHGSNANPDQTFTLAGLSSGIPAPGLNAEPGNAASDPEWNAALFAVASRADVDNGGISLRLPMPDWLTRPAAGRVLTTKDFADIFAFLKSQTR